MRPVDLQTRDRNEALAIYWEFRRQWDAERAQTKAKAISLRLTAATKGNDIITVTDYAAMWRTTHLPTLVKANGKPLSPKTRDDYGRMLANQVETHAPFQSLILGETDVTHLRKFLAQWISSPNHYNYMKSLLSRMFGFAVDEGMLATNPVDNVHRRPVTKRDVYMTDEAYIAITSHLGEFEACACDLLYLVSHRPTDVLSLQDSQVEGDAIRFTAAKNDVDMEIEIDSDLADLIQWFRERKASQDIVSPHLVVYGKDSLRRYIGKPITTAYLSRRFADAVVAAGFERGSYTLRDLRPKGLTDDFLAGGDSDKGGHKTEAMKRHYRRVRLPMRAKNNVKRLRRG